MRVLIPDGEGYVLTFVMDIIASNALWCGGVVMVISGNLIMYRPESGVLSGLYTYFMSAETPQQRGPSADELEATRRAQDCIQECHVEQLIMESKFLRVESLQELLKVCC